MTMTRLSINGRKVNFKVMNHLANVISAICSYVIPGFGQLVQGRWIAAIVYFLVVTICYITVILFPIGLVLHLISIISAAKFKPPY